MQIGSPAIERSPPIYHIGDEWWDLCAGPHVESTKAIHPKAIDLESVAGAYWRSDEKRPMASASRHGLEHAEELKAYNDFKAEVARRDQESGQGSQPVLHPAGGRGRRAGVLAPKGRS